MALKPYESGVPSSERFPGMFLVKQTSKLRVFRPSYNKGRTWFRPWGTVEDGVMVPWRDEGGNFGTNFFVQDRVCNAWGVEFRFTCFTDVSDPSQWPGGSPLEMFQSSLWQSKQFPKLFERGPDKFTPLTQPSVAGFLRGAVIENAGKKYNKNPMMPALLILPKSANEAMNALLNQKVSKDAERGPSTEEDPYGWNAMYTVGDPIGFTHGKLFEFHKESEIVGAGSDDTIDMSGSGVATVASGREKSEIESYAARVVPQVVSAGSPPGVLPLDAGKIVPIDERFEDSFNYMTGEEQLKIILQGFGKTHRDAVLFVFGGQEVLPASYEHRRTVHDMAAAPRPAGTVATPPPAAQSAPAAQPPVQQTPDVPDDDMISFGGDTEDEGSTPDDGLPFDGAAQVDPVEQAADAPQAPQPSSADAIRARLLNLTGGKDTAQ